MSAVSLDILREIAGRTTLLRTQVALLGSLPTPVLPENFDRLAWIIGIDNFQQVNWDIGADASTTSPRYQPVDIFELSMTHAKHGPLVGRSVSLYVAMAGLTATVYELILIK